MFLKGCAPKRTGIRHAQQPAFFGIVPVGPETVFAAAARVGPDTVATKDPNFVSLDTYTIANTTTAELSDNLSLKNVVAYQHSQSLFVLNNGAILYDFAAPLNNPDTGSQVSEEAQVLGKSFNDKMDWIFGVFYSHQDDANINNNTIFKNYNPFTVSLVPYALQHFIGANSTDDSTAVFAHGTYDLGDFVEDTNSIAPPDATTSNNLKNQVSTVLETLTQREAKVLRMRFGIGMNTDHTLEEVGQQFSVTRERIRQIEAKALRKLKHPSRSRKLRSFLDT